MFIVLLFQLMCMFKNFNNKMVCQFLKKLNIQLSYDLVIPPLCRYPKEVKAGSRTDICISMFIAALFTATKTGGNPSVHP